MKEGYSLSHIQCNNCKFAQRPTGTIVERKSEIMPLVIMLHRRSGLICTKPEYIVFYVNVMVSDSVFAAKKMIAESGNVN